MDSREEVKVEQRRARILSRLRPGGSGPSSPVDPLLKTVRGCGYMLALRQDT